MKKQSLYIFCLMLLVPNLLFSQIRQSKEETITREDGTTETRIVESIITEEAVYHPQNMIYINPLQFFFYYNVGYMTTLSDHVALGAALILPAVSDVSGIGVDAEIRIYPGKRALRGFYVSPRLSYSSLNSSFDGTSNGSMEVAGLIGWQWFIEPDFAIGFGLGYARSFLTGSDSDRSSVFDIYDKGRPTLRFDIGYAW